MLKPHVVILGSGFAGTYVGKKLCNLVKKGKIELTIVNKTNYFLFTPLLHEVATGTLSPTSVAEPIREIFRGTGIELSQGDVKTIDLENRRVHIKGNETMHTLTYDFLVIATGAETNYYNIPGAENLTLPLKDLSDAVKIRTKIIDAFEKASMAEDPEQKQELLSFAVVGGGPTGVETAAELSEFVNGILKRYYKKCGSANPNISLIHAGKELLEQFHPIMRIQAQERLVKKGINIYAGQAVKEVNTNSLTLADGTVVKSCTTIWAAGVKAVVPEFIPVEPVRYAGRLEVDKYFRLKNQDNVFALGDVAAYLDQDFRSGQPLPMLAQAAVDQSSVVARNIISAIRGKKMKDFHYHSLGSLVSLGQWYAIGEVMFVRTSGRLTWWLWRSVYLFKFASWRKRIRIGFEWFIGLFYTRDVTKLG